MKRFGWLWALILVVRGGNAQLIHSSAPGDYLGRGAYSTNHTDVFSFIANPAAIAQLEKTSFGVHGERRFFLIELNTFHAAVGVVMRSESFGLEAGYFGFNEYNESKLGLVYGRRLGKKAAVGAAFNYYGIRISGYGSASTLSVSAGAILHLSDRLHAGISICNPAGGRIGKQHLEKLPFCYKAGFGYEASRKFLLEVSIEKEEDQAVNINAGFQYLFQEKLLTRAGISTSNSSEWVGLGIILGSFRLDIITTYHPQLGISPALLIIFYLKRSPPD